MPGVLGRMADRLDQHPEAAVCFGDYLEFGDSELVRAVPAQIDPYRLAYTNECPQSAMFRRSVLEAVGGWPDVRAFHRRLHGDRLLTAAKFDYPQGARSCLLAEKFSTRSFTAGGGGAAGSGG